MEEGFSHGSNNLLGGGGGEQPSILPNPSGILKRVCWEGVLPERANAYGIFFT